MIIKQEREREREIKLNQFNLFILSIVVVVSKISLFSNQILISFSSIKFFENFLNHFVSPCPF